jgi:hypothetical protein
MYVWDDKKKQYVSDTPASRIPVKDSAELFDSNNVEGALAELAGERDAQGITLQDHTGKIENLTEAVDWLKANGGGGGGTGGGGTVMPTISTTDELSQVVPKGQEIVLNVFFSSPNLGQGSLVLLINNKEVNSFTIKQGSNSINIGALKELRNKIVIYVKDRANLVSNEITYNIINGGVSLTLDFDYYADYPADKDVLMRYNIDTDQEDVQLEVTVDNNKSSVACKNGYNEYYFKNLTVGIHAVTVRAVSGQFISETYNFNLVIINSDSLYISSTFGENPKCTLGVPVVIDYRISYKDDTAITLVLTLDGKVNKTLTSKRGSYAWTLNDMTLGSHSYKIDCTLGTDTVSLEGTFVVEAGDYTPLQINTDGLRYQMGCANRTNQDDDKEEFIYDNGTSQITTRLKGFNFETNGWIDGALVCNGGAYAEIDYACMAENAPYSLTVEIDFKATDIGIHDARVLECRDIDTKKGFHVALTEAKLNSISQEAKVYITPEERTTVSLQIDRQNKFAKIYVNGIITSAFKLTDSGSGTSTILESFAHNGKIYVGCDKNLDNIGNCTIYDIRVYERRVSNDEIVKNVIAQEKDLRKQEDLYNFCFNNNTLSTMRLYSDEVENKVSNMTNTNKITMRAVYRSTNTEKYGQPFELKYCKVYWQGTSSLDYIRKNYNLELYDDDLKEFYYSPYPNAVQEYLFCLKCDYMESSHARNVGIGNLINKYWYTSKNPAQLKDAMVQNAVQGFPMLLYINDEFMGVYNFNTDRYSNASFGYTGDNCLAYEVSANSDTTAGAFITYDKTKHEGNELDYYKRDFMCLYPPTRRAGNDTMDEIIDLVKFVDKSSDEEFVTNINNNVYFNKEYLLRYLIYCLVMGAVDSLGKNMKLATWDMGKTWYPQIYDCDTTMGLDNSGMLYYTDSSMKIQAGTYNTSSSRLWSRLIELMWADIQAEYVKMRNTYLTLDNLYSCIINNQMDLIPATYYNSDCETKYLQFGALYLDVLHGQGKQQVMEWLRARLLFLDTYMEYWTTTSEFISLRAGKDGLAYIDLEMFDNMYAQVKWRNTGKDDDALAIQIKEVKKNTVTRFEFKVQASTDQEIRIFGAKYVKSLGDLSNLELVKIDVSNAKRLTKMECHSSKLKNVILSTCTNLQYVDLKDCSTLGSTEQSTKNLDVSRCSNLKYVNCQNTQLQGVTLNPKGSNIHEVYFPKTVQAITMANCPQLSIVGLEKGHECKELNLINCPSITAFGDREYDLSTKKYKYTNGLFLSGLQKINLDNSYINETDLSINHCLNLNEITLKNMPKLERIKVSVNMYNGACVTGNLKQFDTNPDLENMEDLIVASTNCPKLKEFITTDPYDNSGADMGIDVIYFFTTLHGEQYMDYGGRWSHVRKRVLDLSNTNITDIKLFTSTILLGLKVPMTLKNLLINKELDVTDLVTDESYRCRALYQERRSGNQADNKIKYGFNVSPGRGGSVTVLNVWNDSVTDFTPNITKPIWDFKGLAMEEMLYTNSHQIIANNGYYGGNTFNELVQKYTLRNLTLKAKKYALSLYQFSTQENLSLDYSEFTGESLTYAFAGIKQDTILNLPTNLDNLKWAEYIASFADTDKITWKFIEKIFPIIPDGAIVTSFRNMTLKEQTDYETDGISLINQQSISPNGTYYADNVNKGWFYGSNLKYVKEVKINDSSVRGMFSNVTTLEKVGDITIDCGRKYFAGLSNYFRNCINLISVGNIVYNENNVEGEVSCEAMFYGCSNLKNIGTITFLNQNGNKLLNYILYNCSKLTGDIDLTDVKDVTTLQSAFFNCKALNSVKFPSDLSSLTGLNSSFMGAIINEVDLGSLSLATSLTTLQDFCNGATLTNLKGFNAIPDSVTTLCTAFRGANINNGNFVLPNFTNGSSCEHLGGAFDNGSNVQLPSVFTIPAPIKYLDAMCNGNKNMPRTLIFDCSKATDIINNRNVFKDCKGLEELTWKLPQHIWYGNIDNRSSQASLYFLYGSTAKKITLDYSSYKGNCIGTDGFLPATDNLELYGVDFNLTGHTAMGDSRKFIKAFTVHGACNTRDIDLRAWRMSYDTHVKFIEEAIATLDCANKMTHLTQTQALYLGTTSTSPVSTPGFFTDYIPVKEKTKYTLKINDILNNVANGGSVFVYWYTDIDTPLKGGLNTFSYADWESKYGTNGRAFDSYVNKLQAKYFRIGFNRLENTDLNGMNKYIDQDIISFKVVSPTSTPKTLTASKYTNYADTEVLSSDQQNALALKATPKGWNVVFI